jgi:hypothetical protein
VSEHRATCRGQATADAVLLLGDLNTTAETPELGRLRSAGLRDAYAEARGAAPDALLDDAASATWDPLGNQHVRAQVTTCHTPPRAAVLPKSARARNRARAERAA